MNNESKMNVYNKRKRSVQVVNYSTIRLGDDFDSMQAKKVLELDPKDMKAFNRSKYPLQ